LVLRTVADDLFVRAPDTVALIEGDNTWTYGEFAVSIRSAAGRLRDVGVGLGDRVYIVAGPGRLALAATFAALRLGATPALVNPRLTSDEVRALVDLAGDGAAVVTDATSRGLGEALAMPALGSQLLEPTDLDASPGTADADIGLVLFTSGTTGLPKPIPVPWPTLTARLRPYVEPPATGVRMLCVPIHHVGGLLGSMVCLLGGHTTVVQPRFEPGEWLRLVERHRVQLTFVVPTMLARIVDHPDIATTDLSSLQTVTYGASPMPGDLVARLTDVMPHVALINTFGQTETLGGITFTTPEDAHHPVHRESVGRLVPGTAVRVLIPGTDDEVAPGDVGELVVKSEQNVVDGWLRTGDLVRIDEDGYLYPHGRLSDTINRGGEKFGPIEVETALRAHPLVTDCAVAGVPDPEMNERVGAVVVTSEPVGVAALQQWCAERIAKYKTPELVTFADEVPLTDMGKVDRKAVVRLLSGGS
jgi:long-chain acyl-CoA synthetase